MRISLMMLFMMLQLAFLFGQSKLPRYKPDESTSGLMSFNTLLTEYIRHQVGIVDSVIETHEEEGEGYQSVVTYYLRGGHTYIETTLYESWSLVIVFDHVRKKVVQELLIALLKQADRWTEEREEWVMTKDSYDIPVEEGCCFFSVSVTDGSVMLEMGLDEER